MIKCDAKNGKPVWLDTAWNRNGNLRVGLLSCLFLFFMISLFTTLCMRACIFYFIWEKKIKIMKKLVISRMWLQVLVMVLFCIFMQKLLLEMSTFQCNFWCEFLSVFISKFWRSYIPHLAKRANAFSSSDMAAAVVVVYCWCGGCYYRWCRYIMYPTLSVL